MYHKLFLPLTVSSLLALSQPAESVTVTFKGTDFTTNTSFNETFDSFAFDLDSSDSGSGLFNADATNLDYSACFNGMELYDVDIRPASGGGVTGEFTSDLLGASESFSGANRQEVEEQILEFVLGLDLSSLSSLSSKTLEQTMLAQISDGRPDSNTALSANQVFDSGLDASTPKARKEQGSSDGGVQILAGSSSIKINGVSGSLHQLPLKFKIPLSGDRVGTLRVPLAFSKFGDAKAYHAGLQFSVPFTVLDAPDKAWVLSPAIGVSGTFSDSFDNQSSVFNLGLTSSYTQEFDKFYVTLGNHISNYAISDVEVNGFTVANSRDQQILKNGVKLTVPLEDRGWEIEGYLIHTAFLGSATVDEYFTPGLQVTKVHPQYGRLTVRLEADIGEDYDSLGLHLGAGFKF